MHLIQATETDPPQINRTALSGARVREHLVAAGHGVCRLRPCRRGETKAPQASDSRSATSSRS